jgi:membrane dipeptidase
MKRELLDAPRLIIDGHADTPQRLLDEQYDLATPLGHGNLNFDSARAGNLGAEFFAIWVQPERHKGRYAHRALELIDAVYRQAEKHPDRMALATGPDELLKANSDGKLAVLLGIEGGHAIENSLALLRLYHRLGVRYMTLTWANSNDWADSSGDIEDASIPHTDDGLTGFGEQVVLEMNRLGMMVDISHVADRTFERVLATSKAPVFASHSCARALCDSPRNLTDDMLRTVAAQGGLVMVNFYSAFLSNEYREAALAQRAEIDTAEAALRKQAAKEGRIIPPAEIEALIRSYADRIPRPPFSLLIDHIDHIAKIAGIDHVGIGSDFDGVSGQMPEGMDSAADMVKIEPALRERGYSEQDCAKILSSNFLRYFREVQSQTACAAGGHFVTRVLPAALERR